MKVKNTSIPSNFLKTVKSHVISKQMGKMNIAKLVYTFMKRLATLGDTQKYQPGFAASSKPSCFLCAVEFLQVSCSCFVLLLCCYFSIHCYYHVKYFYDP